MMRIMKKAVFAVIGAVLLNLVSCGAEHAGYYNDTGGCMLGDTYYTEFAGTLTAYNSAVGGRLSLCRDPLCTHDGKSTCPESIRAYSVVTDGKKLFVKSNVFDSDGPRNVIYALIPEDSSLTELVSFGAVDGEITDIACDGKYIYYTEGFYRETDAHGDSYGVLMRVRCKGGTPQVAVSGDWSAEAELYADEKSYYVCDRGVVAVIDRESGERKDYDSPLAYSSGMILYGGAIYQYGASEMEERKAFNTVFLESSESLYRFDGDGMTLVTDGMSYPSVFGDGAIWYTPRLPIEEYELVGTKNLPTGGGGDSPYDFIRRSDGTIVKVDLASGEKQTWTLESKYINAEMRAYTDGAIFATVKDLRDMSTDYKNCRLILNDDGTVSIIESETDK